MRSPFLLPSCPMIILPQRATKLILFVWNYFCICFSVLYAGGQIDNTQCIFILCLWSRIETNKIGGINDHIPSILYIHPQVINHYKGFYKTILPLKDDNVETRFIQHFAKTEYTLPDPINVYMRSTDS